MSHIPGDYDESQLEKTILEYLALKNIFAFPTHGPRNRPLMTGIPDILGVNPHGIMIAIEVKSMKGVLSHHQQTFLASLAKRGAITIVARTLEDVMKAGL